MLQREPAGVPGRRLSPGGTRRKPVRGSRRIFRLALLLLGAALLWILLGKLGLVREPFREPPAVTGLHPKVEAQGNELVALARKRGIDLVFTGGFRSKEEQDALYGQGRVTEGPVVTKAKGGESYHNYGLAVDFALRTKQGDVVWDMERDDNSNGRPDWEEVVALAKDLGFTWGGDWVQFPDYPHLQMDFGYTIRQLKNGKYPSGTRTAAND